MQYKLPGAVWFTGANTGEHFYFRRLTQGENACEISSSPPQKSSEIINISEDFICFSPYLQTLDAIDAMAKVPNGGKLRKPRP